jgi:ABC-type nickel/cobalt efflux system permease component RcnA
MDYLPQLLLIGAVTGVGVLHTLVPDHWAPIMILARQHGWSRAETARAALRAGMGHVGSTLALGVIVWVAGTAVAQRFGVFVSIASGLMLVAFGFWLALSAMHEIDFRREDHHEHDHGRHHKHQQDAIAHGHTSEVMHEHAPQEHGRKTSARTALLLILGSSPMVKGIPAFFAAGRYGVKLIVLMAVCFALSTVLTYVVISVYSTATLRRLRFTTLERYGEVLSGLLIALIGMAFTIWSVW